MKLDRIDYEILRQLQLHGRMTNVQLADAVGLSASPCLTRVKRLETGGIIIGYAAQLDIAKFDNFVSAYVEVELENHRRTEAARFERAVCRIEEVVEFHMINGKYDYLLKIVAQGYEGVSAVVDELWTGDLGMKSFAILMITSTPIRRRSLPIHGDGNR